MLSAGSSMAWSGRVVLVTGASRGIGKATAHLFARRGAQVVAHGRDEAQLAEVRDQWRNAGYDVTTVLGDLRDPEAPARIVAEAVAAYGRIDVLVNNAGANVFEGVLDCSQQAWDDCLALDLRAPWLCVKEAVAFMPHGGAIVTVGSNHAGATLGGVFPYNVAKAGLRALNQSLAIELAAHGLRSNLVEPGYIDTPINDTYFDSFADPAAARQHAESLHPVQRLGSAEEVAESIAYLADSRISGFITGSIITVDGGRSALMQDPS